MDRSKWEYKKLEVDNLPIGDVFDIFMGRTPSRDDLSLWEDGSHEWVSIGDMGTTKYISDTKEKVSDKACTNMRLVPKDTVIMSFKLSIGKVAITEIPLYTNEAIMAFPPKSGYNISPNYLYYHLQAYKWQSANRAVMGKTLNKAVISSSRITIPDLETQQLIVAELDCLNEMIALKQGQLKEFDKLAQSIFYDMFGNPSKEIKRWDVFTLEELIQNNVIIYHLDGNHGGDYPRSDEFVDSGITYIGANCIKDGVIDFSLAKYLTEEKANSLRKGIAKDGDVLFAHNATVGPVALLRTNKEKIILSTTLTAFRCNNTKLIPEFLKAYMESAWFVCQYASVMKQATRNQVPITKQRKMSFILPPLALQQQFAEKIQAIESQKELVKKSISETQHLLDSRMDYYFD